MAFSQLAITSFDQSVPEKVPLASDLGFFLTHSVGRRDLDNMLKFTIDTLADFYRFNDSRVYSIKTYKRLLEGSKDEVLYYKIYQDPHAKEKINMNDLV
jgi:Holliday junction resolvase RusA-like endonuclease